LVHWLDTQHGIVEKLETDGVFQNGEWKLHRRGTTAYQRDMTAYNRSEIHGKYKQNKRLRTNRVNAPIGFERMNGIK